MELPDTELVRLLVDRDGEPARAWGRHGEPGACAFRDKYPGGDCPWCAAQARRNQDPPSVRAHQNVFILMFRGINVGGNKIVRMETLQKVLEASGFGSVATYIQSGNVVLTSNEDETLIVSSVETAFTQAFGFSSRLTVRSLDNWRRLIAANPFADADRDGKQVHAVFLGDIPTDEAVRALEALATTERIELQDTVLYLHTPDGFGRSKVAEALDKVLKVPLTARNWNTVTKLQEMAEGMVRE